LNIKTFLRTPTVQKDCTKGLLIIRAMCAKNFSPFACIDCKIITFEVSGKILFSLEKQEQQTLSPHKVRFLLCLQLSLYTIEYQKF